ncbi:hypothetical protein ACFT7S_07455 [Streptomyces sp. NPDC057136]|uniref:beta-xylosidase family glycoside hydrolase n=1 Tax=Streptomyces sp. NPDC057136 TaxID=3346029 RepID=UPI0036263027
MSRTPGWHVLGREAFLAPVTWDDGDDFDRSELHPTWISVRDRSAEHWTTKERPRSLTLRARGASLDEPDVVLVGLRHQYRACRARPLIDPAQGCGGLAVRLDEEHRYEIEADGTEARGLARRLGARRLGHTAGAPGPDCSRRAESRAAHTARRAHRPDVVSLGVELPDGTFTSLATLDGRCLPTEAAGDFIGRVIGLHAAQGVNHFDRYGYEPLTA